MMPGLDGFGLLGALPPEFATGRQIANLDLGGFEFDLASVGFGFPAIAALEEFGQKDSRRSAIFFADL